MTRGSVRLSGSAPSGGAVVTLSTSTTAAVAPATVVVPAGAEQATFDVEASTVMTSTAVTVSASYLGVTRTAALTVRPPVVTAAFTVTSRTRGRDSCVLGPSTGEADCSLDGTSSVGPVHRWVWRYWAAGAPIGHESAVPSSGLNLATRCAFFEGARGGDGPNGDRYIRMEIELAVQDVEGTRSAPVRREIRMYPNRLCGFSY
jgi:hypothetical protein